MNAGVLAGILAAAAVVMMAVGMLAGGRKTVVEERLGDVTSAQAVVVTGDEMMAGQRASPIADILEARFSGSRLFGNMARDLARADLKLRPAEYIAAIIISGVGVGIVGGILARALAFSFVAGIGGLFIPIFYVRSRQSARLHSFEAQLPDMVNLTVNSLRAGYSIMQALEAVSKEMPAPISLEMRRVVQEIQLGISLEVALDNLLRRVASADLKLMVTAMNIQREVGGNLAEILDTISFTIRERIRIKGEIRVLTAQQRITGYMIGMVPFVLALFLYFVNRTYIMQFFNPATRICGIPMVITGLLMIFLGFFAVQKIASIEV
ncbi:MAG TPA: type II secretion system F family protein [Anaerolineales bacterium]|nr:type II secretion system F family protein [Anaerolineales bacterium]